jgi:hypothetical protein
MESHNIAADEEELFDIKKLTIDPEISLISNEVDIALDF